MGKNKNGSNQISEPDRLGDTQDGIKRSPSTLGQTDSKMQQRILPDLLDGRDELEKQNEIIFSSFLEHSPIYIFFKDKRNRVLRLSKNYQQILGMPINAALGKTMDELFPSDLASSMTADDLQVFENGKMVEVVEEFSGRTYETTKFPILVDGIPAILAGFTLDITERKQAEEALKQAEAKYHAIFENALEGIFQSSPDGSFITVNAAMAHIFGYSSPDEMIAAIGNQIRTKIYADPYQRNRFVQMLEADGAVKEFEAQNLRKDGSMFWTKTNARAIRDTHGSVLYYEGFLEDITERKHYEDGERKQRALAEALRDTAAALNSTLKFEDVLDGILDNVGKVGRYDVVYMMLIDDQQNIARVVRQHDTRTLTPEHAKDVSPLEFFIPQTRNLQEMLTTGAPYLVTDTHKSADWTFKPSTTWIRANLSVPIKIKGATIGFLGLDSASANAFTLEDAGPLQAFANQAANAIENAQLYENVQKLAITDDLTGLFNRRGLYQMGEREVERGLRFNRPLAIVMLDIDHFKDVNDTYGHPTGDRVLVALAACCETHVRSVDLLARYGGEEFILLLTETDLAAAGQVAERIRCNVENMLVPVDADENTCAGTLRVTVSLGVVALKPETPNLTNLIERVDYAMYQAKTSGRNRVFLAE